MRNRGNVRCVIHRPAIIACANKQPFPGWTDSISAAGGLTVLGGVGLLKLMPTAGENRFDVIPADIVSNSILIVSAHSAIMDIPFDVYNCGSSVQNPVTIGNYARTIVDNLSQYHFKDRVNNVSGIDMEPNQMKYEIKKNLTERWPIAILDKVLKMPFIGNK